MIPEALLFLMAALLAALCNIAETSFSAAGRIRAAAAAEAGLPMAKTALWFISEPSRYLSTTLVGTNVGVVLASGIASGWVDGLSPLFSYLQVILTAGFLLVAAEIIPKQNALLRADSLIRPLSPVLVAFRFLFYPLTSSAGLFSRLIAGRPSINRFFESREEVRGLLEVSGGLPGRTAWDAIELGETDIRSHARSVDSFPSISLGASRQEATEKIIGSSSDFLLVREGRTLSGILESRVVLKSAGAWNPGRMMTGIPAYTEDTAPLQVLTDLWRSGSPAAVVLDANGQPGGILVQEAVLDRLLYRNTLPDSP
jgi:CBS domain containing-hemolysin-like protein